MARRPGHGPDRVSDGGGVVLPGELPDHPRSCRSVAAPPHLRGRSRTRRCCTQARAVAAGGQNALQHFIVYIYNNIYMLRCICRVISALYICIYIAYNTQRLYIGARTATSGRSTRRLTTPSACPMCVTEREREREGERERERERERESDRKSRGPAELPPSPSPSPSSSSSPSSSPSPSPSPSPSISPSISSSPSPSPSPSPSSSPVFFSPSSSPAPASVI